MSEIQRHIHKYHRAIAVLIFLFGIWYFCLRILGYNLEYIPGDLGDSRFINFLLEHNFQWMNGNTSFWSSSFMYPVENTIAISDNMVGTMPLYSIWRYLGVSSETSFQLWWLLICSLNFWVTYYIVKKWFNRWELAIIIAWIFAFTIFNIGQITYMQMIIRFVIPVVIYTAAKLVETSEMKYLLFLAIGLVFQFYCVIYTGFFLFYFTIGFLLMYALVTKKYFFFKPLFKRTNWMQSTSIIVGSIALLLLLMLPYYSISQELGLKLFGEVKWSLPTWKSYLFVHDSSTTWSILSESTPTTKEWWLHYSFPGLIPLIGLLSIPFYWIYASVKKIKLEPKSKVFSIVAFIIFLLFIRTESGYTLYALIFKLPGMNSMRVLNRYWHVELFFVLIFIATFLKKFKLKWLGLFLVLAIVDNSFDAELVPRVEKTIIASRKSTLHDLIEKKRTQAHESFVVIGDGNNAYLAHIDAMLVSQQLQFPTINGYSSSCPDAFGKFFNGNTRENLNEWITLKGIDSNTVLIIEPTNP